MIRHAIERPGLDAARRRRPWWCSGSSRCSACRSRCCPPWSGRAWRSRPRPRAAPARRCWTGSPAPWSGGSPPWPASPRSAPAPATASSACGWRASGRPTPTACGSRPRGASRDLEAPGVTLSVELATGDAEPIVEVAVLRIERGESGAGAHGLRPRGAGARAGPARRRRPHRDGGPHPAPRRGPPAGRRAGRPRAHPGGPGRPPALRGRSPCPPAAPRPGPWCAPAGARGRRLAGRPRAPCASPVPGARACWATWPRWRWRRCRTAPSSASTAGRGRSCASSARRRPTPWPWPPGARARAARARRRAPAPGSKIEVVEDRSGEVVAALRELGLAALIGLVLGVAVLRVMLGRWRPTLALAVVVPASLLATFSGLPPRRRAAWTWSPSPAWPSPPACWWTARSWCWSPSRRPARAARAEPGGRRHAADRPAGRSRAS